MVQGARLYQYRYRRQAFRTCRSTFKNWLASLSEFGLFDRRM